MKGWPKQSCVLPNPWLPHPSSLFTQDWSLHHHSSQTILQQPLHWNDRIIEDWICFVCSSNISTRLAPAQPNKFHCLIWNVCRDYRNIYQTCRVFWQVFVATLLSLVFVGFMFVLVIYIFGVYVWACHTDPQGPNCIKRFDFFCEMASY